MTECYLYKGVHGHDGHVWLTLGVVHQVKIDQLFQFQVVRLHAVHDVREQGAAQGTELCGYYLQSQGDLLQCSLTAISPGSPNIFANCHRRNDLLHGLLLLLFLIAVQLCLELKYFPCAEKRKTHLVRSIGGKRLK